MKQAFMSLLVILIITSCKQEQEHAHDEESGLEGLVYTIYTDKTELFVEFKPLVVGDESRFAAHFTILGESFLPITEGSVTLSLSGSAGTQSITADVPEVPGIFRLGLTPEKAGEYKLVFDIKTPSYTDQITIDATVYPDEEAAIASQEPASGGGNEISYLKEQAWKIDFANFPVKRLPFFGVVKTSGLVSSAPGDEQTISSKTSGVVSLNGNGIYAGSEVRAGQNLFTISSKGFTDGNANVQLQEAKSNYEKAKTDYERNQKLFTDKLITQKDFVQSKTDFENAEALYNSLSGNYSQGGQIITSPQSGFVKSLLVTEGQFVEAGQTLATISKNKRLVVKAEISSTALAKAGNITTSNFRVNNEKVYSLEELNGKMVSVGKSADNSLFIPVFFEIDNKEGIIPGTFIEVFIKTDAMENAIAIPVSALIEEQGNYYAYVQTEGESFEKRELLLGSNDGKQVLVLSGINEGERVVTKGAYNIKLSSASGTMPAHGHEH